MTNGRKTTYDERVEIVKYCIEHQNNYAETAEYQVSYQQVYTWTINMKKTVLRPCSTDVGKERMKVKCLNWKS